MEENNKKLIRVKELSKISGIGLSTITKYIRHDLLKYTKQDEDLTRYYEKSNALKRLKEIKRLEDEGATSSEMQEYFGKKDFKMPKVIVKPMTEKEIKKIQKLTQEKKIE